MVTVQRVVWVMVIVVRVSVVKVRDQFTVTVELDTCWRCAVLGAVCS